MPPELWRIVFDHLSLKSLIHLYLTKSSCSNIVGRYLDQKYTSFEIIWEMFPQSQENSWTSREIHLPSWAPYIPLTQQLLQKILDLSLPKFNIDTSKGSYEVDKRKEMLEWLAINPSLTHELIEACTSSEYLSHKVSMRERHDRVRRTKPKVFHNNPCPPLEIILLYENYWDWKELSRSTSLTEAIIQYYSHRWDWKELSSNPCLTPAIIIAFENFWDWNELSTNPCLTLEIIQRYEKRWNWGYLSRNSCLTLEMIEMYLERWGWIELGANLNLPPDIIIKYIDRLDQHYFCFAQRKLPASFIEKNFDKFTDPKNELCWCWPDLTQSFAFHNWRVILDHPEWPWNFYISDQ